MSVEYERNVQHYTLWVESQWDFNDFQHVLNKRYHQLLKQSANCEYRLSFFFVYIWWIVSLYILRPASEFNEFQISLKWDYCVEFLVHWSWTKFKKKKCKLFVPSTVWINLLESLLPAFRFLSRFLFLFNGSIFQYDLSNRIRKKWNWDWTNCQYAGQCVEWSVKTANESWTKLYYIESTDFFHGGQERWTFVYSPLGQCHWRMDARWKM